MTIYVNTTNGGKLFIRNVQYFSLTPSGVLTVSLISVGKRPAKTYYVVEVVGVRNRHRFALSCPPKDVTDHTKYKP